MSFAPRLDHDLKRRLVRLMNGNTDHIDRCHRILHKVKTVQKSREHDEHILPSDVPSHTHPSSRTKAKLSLKHIFHMLVHVPLGIESSWLEMFFGIRCNMEMITDENCSRLETVTFVFVVFR